MAAIDFIHVEVVYAQPEHQRVVALELPAGSTAGQAVSASGLLESATTSMPLAVYGRRVALDTCLQEGDRVEICRPLQNDPKTTRRELAKAGRSMGR